MRYEGLLTGAQHCAGYFTMADEDFLFLFHRDNGHPILISIFILADAKIKDVREVADNDAKNRS